MKELFQLYFIFAYMGATVFGGGYAILPILTKEFVEKRNWITDDELADYFAIGQCTPGLIAVNVATFIGNKRKGLLGGMFATVGFISVPIFIIIIIAAFLGNFAHYQIVKNAFAGIRVCVCVLIVNAVLRLWKKSVVDIKTLLIFIIIFALSAFSDYLPVSLSPAILVLCAGAAGILLKRTGGDKK